MAKSTEALYAFNRGLISPLAAARVDLKRTALSATEQTNFMPRVLGAMSLRPGLGYLFSTFAATRFLPFVFATDDTALVELSAGLMRVAVNDALITRPAISSTIVGTATASFASWTNANEPGGASISIADIMTLSGDETGAGVREQTVTIPSIGVVHALVVVVSLGAITLKVGSVTNTDDLVTETTLLKGTHSIAFTPLASPCYVRVSNRRGYQASISSITFAPAGVMTLPTPWATAQNLTDVRHDQSGDVIFVACTGVRQMRLERRSSNSWSVVDYVADLGPFRPINLGTTTIAVTGLTGLVTLTASRALFKATHVGALFRIVSKGQNVAADLVTINTSTGNIRVSGVGADRAFTRVISGTWTGTLTLQRSIGAIGLWTDVVGVVNGTVVFNDTFDNQIIYYRITATAAMTGSASVTINYPVGSITGTARAVAYTSPVEVTAQVITPFGSTIATANWEEGEWSDYRGYPSAVAISGGRMWWAGKDKQWGSVSDAYSNYEEAVVGDSGPISRSIGKGPVDKIRWLLDTDHLIMGGQGAEFVVRSSSLDEPVTPTNYNLKSYTGRGSGALSGVALDTAVLFIDRSGSRVIEITSDQYGRFSATDITAITPEVCQPSAVRMVAQRLPDTRVHVVLSDGTAAVIIYDRVEDVKCWLKVATDGLIRDAVVLPGTDGEDKVYYVVQRTVGGVPVYYLEKWAKESECTGAALTKLADAFVAYTGGATAAITGLGHLEGRTVVCWANGVDQGTFVVANGSITLPAAVTNAVVGLTYRARFRSTKMGYIVQGAPNLVNHQRLRVDHVSLILQNTHAQGLKYGTDFSYLDDMPLIEDGAAVDITATNATYDNDPIELNGTIDTNTTLCLEANAPRPCTVLGAILGIVGQ